MRRILRWSGLVSTMAAATLCVAVPAQAHTQRVQWAKLSLNQTITVQKRLIVQDWKIISTWETTQARQIHAGAVWRPEPADVRWHIRHMKWTKRELHERLRALSARRAAAVRSYGGGNVSLGQQMAARFGWTGGEWDALYRLWNFESGWDVYSHNPHSDACGIPQAMNDCSYGHDPAVQIAWGLSYIRGRYGSPSAALGHFYSVHWY